MERSSLAALIVRQIAQQAGLYVIVEEEGDLITLSGTVDSAADRRAAEDIATELAPRRQVENNLEVEAILPEEESGVLAPDFIDRPMGSATEEDGAEGAEVYFPPTDPVITTGELGEVEILGGFSSTSMDDVEVEASAEDAVPGDEALAEAIRRELREDAATTDLVVRVVVRRGVAYLRGGVPTIEDAENAEAVAARIPGVVEVVEQLEVGKL